MVRQRDQCSAKCLARTLVRAALRLNLQFPCTILRISQQHQARSFLTLNMASKATVTKAGRKTKPINRLGSSSPVRPVANGSSRRTQAKSDPLSSFLASLYLEIDGHRGSPVANGVQVAIQLHMRRTRLELMLDMAPLGRRREYVDSLTAYSPSSHPGFLIAHLVHIDLAAIGRQNTTRVAGFAASLGFPLLSICLHSATFRAALRIADTNQLTWQQRMTAISARAASLELFATTRGIDFMQFITDSDDHYQFIANNILQAELQRDRSNQSTTSRLDLDGKKSLTRKIHIGNNSRFPHLWRLQADNRRAIRCRLKYNVTTDHARDNTQLTAEDERDDLMEEISASIMLRNYMWPDRFTQWPEQDPRYIGVNAEPCMVCDVSVDCVPNERHRNRYTPARCQCTFQDMQAAGYAINPLVELFTTVRTGTGVRALQNIKKGDILGEYTGEMYPDFQGSIINRYGGSEAGGYAVGMEMLPRRLDKTTFMPVPLKGHAGYAVDSALKGNWTRFINHSCDYNTTFERINIGQRETLLIQARKPIKFGQEITVDYDVDYFVGFGIGCKCGALKCKFWDETNIANNRMTLGEAVETHQRPQWAVDDAEVQAAVQAKNAT